MRAVRSIHTRQRTTDEIIREIRSICGEKKFALRYPATDFRKFFLQLSILVLSFANDLEGCAAALSYSEWIDYNFY